MNPVKKLDSLRYFYKSQMTHSGSPEVQELREIKNEIKISNDVKAKEELIGELTHSPYLTDQAYYKKDAVYNSPRETDWKEVRSEEQNKQEAVIFRNLRRLNIV